MIWNNLELPDKNIYFKDEAVVIYHADCRDILPSIPDKSIDLVLTDPPYGVSFKKKGEPYMIGDHINPLPWLYPNLHKILKDDGAVFAFSSMSYVTESLLSFQTYFKLHNIIIWDKINPIYPRSKAHFRLQYEPILYGSKGLHNLKNKKSGDVIQCQIPRGNIRKHPTQKPVDLIKTILNSTLDTKEIILDPFLGSGTTAYCAKKLGRKCIGIEIEEKYCEIAAKRLSQSVMRLI